MKRLLALAIVLFALLLSSCEIALREGENYELDLAVKTSDPLSPLSYKASIVKFELGYDTIFRSLSYKAIIEVENRGSKNLEVKNTRFELLNEAAEVVHKDEAIMENVSQIKPGERGYYYNHFDALEDIEEVDISQLRATLTVSETEKEARDFEFDEVSIRDRKDGVSVFGKLKNKLASEEKVRLGLVCYDKDGKVLDVKTEVVKGLGPGRTMSFGLDLDQSKKLDYRRFKREDIGSYQLAARAMSFDKEGGEEEPSFSLIRLAPKEEVELRTSLDENNLGGARADFDEYGHGHSFEQAERLRKRGKPAPENSYKTRILSLHFFDEAILNREFRAIVEIENLGEENLYAEPLGFHFKDASGSLIKGDFTILSYPEIIAPGEKGYLSNMAFGSELGLDVDVDSLTLNPMFRMKTIEKSPLVLDVTDTKLEHEEGSYYFTINGRVTNNTGRYVEKYDVYVFYYGEDGRVIALGATREEEIKAGDSQEFEIKSFIVSDEYRFEDIKEYRVIAQQNLVQLWFQNVYELIFESEE